MIVIRYRCGETGRQEFAGPDEAYTYLYNLVGRQLAWWHDHQLFDFTNEPFDLEDDILSWEVDGQTPVYCSGHAWRPEYPNTLRLPDGWLLFNLLSVAVDEDPEDDDG